MASNCTKTKNISYSSLTLSFFCRFLCKPCVIEWQERENLTAAADSCTYIQSMTCFFYACQQFSRLTLLDASTLATSQPNPPVIAMSPIAQPSSSTSPVTITSSAHTPTYANAQASSRTICDKSIFNFDLLFSG